MDRTGIRGAPLAPFEIKCLCNQTTSPALTLSHAENREETPILESLNGGFRSERSQKLTAAPEFGFEAEIGWVVKAWVRGARVHGYQ
jgi:hypothetical protein